jgi:hypothetical protein
MELKMIATTPVRYNETISLTNIRMPNNRKAFTLSSSRHST